MEGTKWADYIGSAPVNIETFTQHRRECSPVFENQRSAIGQIFAAHQPKRIACLGAGYLSDIPIFDFLRAGCQVHLVDWIPGVSRQGFKWSLIRSQGGQYSCQICHEDCDPTRFCAAFREPVKLPHRVCDNFALSNDEFAWCEAYRQGEEPGFLEADVTAGRATGFAERILRLMAASNSPQQAIRKAITECRKWSTISHPIDLKDDSMDFITSSMVASQFDHEPYAYFVSRLAEKFGEENIQAKRERLEPIGEKLRSDLFQIQIAGHVDELYRVVNKTDGLVYFSVEIFRSVPERTDFFIVHGVPRLIELLSEKFFFDFQTIPLDRTLMQTDVGDGESVTISLLLKPRSASK